MNEANDSQLIQNTFCPQCGNYALQKIIPITNESSTECHFCGYQEMDLVQGKEIFHGYGALTINDSFVLFHEPILFKKEQEILKGISENPNTSFFKWTDEHGLTVLKGELPADPFDEETIRYAIEEQSYHKSFKTCTMDDYRHLIDFN